MTLELYLIGTVHVDPKGRRRLEKLLAVIKPGIVSVEFSSDAVSELEQYRPHLANPAVVLEAARRYFSGKGGNVDTASAIIRAVGFEYFSAKKYCRRAGAPLLTTDKLSGINPHRVALETDRMFQSWFIGQLKYFIFMSFSLGNSIMLLQISSNFTLTIP